MFHNLQESDPDLNEVFQCRPEKQFITFSSTISDDALTRVSHVGSYYIMRRLANVYLSLVFAVMSCLLGIWLISNIRPDYREVQVSGHETVAQSIGADPLAVLSGPSQDLNTGLTPKDPGMNPDPYGLFANNGIEDPTVIAHMHDPATPIPYDVPPAVTDPNTPSNIGQTDQNGILNEPPQTQPPPPVPYVGFDEGDAWAHALSAPLTHTVMQPYTDTTTWIGNILRFVIGTLCAAAGFSALAPTLEYLIQLLESLQVKYAQVKGGDLIRRYDSRGRQLGILYESLRDAVRRHNRLASVPVSEREVMDLFKASLDDVDEENSTNDLIVSKYLIDTDILEEKLQIKDFPMKKQLRQQMRDIAEGVAASILPAIADAIYEQHENKAAAETKQKFLEQRQRDSLMEEAHAVLLGTEHLKAKLPV